MRRFFLEVPCDVGETVTLADGESRHISQVLRLGPGSKVELLDGSGLVYSASLLTVGRQVQATITAVRSERETGEVRLLVGQGLLKGQKMDVVVQKCTELGVTHLLPFWSSRCQGKLDDEQHAKKLLRYRRVVESACKQCCRPDLMAVDVPRSFRTVLEDFPAAAGRLRLLFWEEERSLSLHEVTVPLDLREAVILLGPEGGLSTEEVARAQEAGWVTVSLGRRILRAETATLAAVSLLQFLTGNI
ncbi:MAG: 16S rRNA (uracil(1498)-N(3))-methyltransferase [Desulfopila sp.]